MTELLIAAAAVLCGGLALALALQLREERRHREDLERFRRSLRTQEDPPWDRY